MSTDAGAATSGFVRNFSSRRSSGSAVGRRRNDVSDAGGVVGEWGTWTEPRPSRPCIDRSAGHGGADSGTRDACGLALWHIYVVRCRQIERASDDLFEGEEAVLHLMGEQIVGKKRRNPWTLDIVPATAPKDTRRRCSSPAGANPGFDIAQQQRS